MAISDVPDTQNRFQQARDRYNQTMQARNTRYEGLESDSSDATTTATLLDFLRKKQIEKTPKLLNDNKKSEVSSLPLPLPVKPVDNASLIEQVKTNAKLDDINKGVRKTPIPIPLKIDDSNISSENTLRRVVEYLDRVDQHLVKFDDHLSQRVDVLGESVKRGLVARVDEGSTGWAARAVGRTLDFFRERSTTFESVSATIARWIKPAAQAGEKSVEFLKKILDVQVRMLQRIDLTGTDRARQLLMDKQTIGHGFDEPEEKVGAFTGLSRQLFPEDSKIRRGMNIAAATAGFFGSLGAMATTALMNNFGTQIATAVKVMPSLGRVFGTLANLSRFLTGVIGFVVASPIYAAFKNPDQLAGYMEAFGRLFSENVVPTLRWISVEIVPVVAKAFAALAYVADILMDSVGTYINKGAIFALNAISDILTVVGKSIDALWQGFKNWGSHIIGIFGYGDNADKGILGNLLGAFTSIADGMMEFIGIWATQVISAFGMSDFFGLQSDESIWGRLKRFFMVDIPNAAIRMFDEVNSYIKELNPTEMIKQKFSDMIDMIVGIFPTWEDIKGWITNIIPTWVPGRDRLVRSLTPDAPASPAPRNTQPSTEAPLSPWDRQQMNQGSIIYAPSNTNNTSNIMSGSRGSARGAVGPTRVIPSPIDNLINRAAPY